MQLSLRHFFLTSFLFCLVLSGARAQVSSSVQGGLGGQVTDSSGALVSGAKVTVTGPQGSTTTTTDQIGQWRVTGLIPGYYDVSAEAPGFKKAESKHNEVVVDVTSTLNLKLEVGSTRSDG